jgi:hypothetical protein
MNANIPQVPLQETDILTFEFTNGGSQKASFQNKTAKATYSDSFQAQIYQTFWAIIKDGLKPLFEEFPNERLPLCTSVSVVVTLLTSGHEATMIQRYRPMYVFGMLFSLK